MITEQRRSGSIDHVLAYMKKHHYPMNRETYLNLAYMGNPPEELCAEEEAQIPEQFQEWKNEEED